MEDKYVYYDKRDFGYSEISKEAVEKGAESLAKDWFGYIDDQLDSNNELIIYKLVPFKVLKKDVNYKFK